jgi:acyl carrier protein
MPIDRETIEKKVRDMIVDSLGIDPEKISNDSSFVDDLGADSLDTVELVMAFEEEFGVEIPDEDAERLLTVGDAIDYLEKNISE